MNTHEQIKNLQWLEPWTSFAGAGLEAELKREVGSEHPLYEQEAVCVGRRADNDDVLFYLPNAVVPLAVVSLNREANINSAELPATNFYYSIEDFINERMKPDYIDFTRGSFEAVSENTTVQSTVKEDLGDTARRSGIAYAAVLALVMSVVVCLVAGLMADRYFETSYGVIIGILIGAIVGFYQFIRMMNRVK